MTTLGDITVPKYYIAGLGYSPSSGPAVGGGSGYGFKYGPEIYSSTFFGSDVKSLLPAFKFSSRKSRKFSSKKSKKSKKWITKTGKLGGKGFLHKKSRTQHKIINKCVDEYGRKSCMGSLLVLNRNRKISKKYSKKINKLVSYLKNKKK